MHNAIGYACIYVDFVVKNIEQVPPLIIRDIYIPEFLKTGLAKIRAHSTTWQLKAIKSV